MVNLRAIGHALLLLYWAVTFASRTRRGGAYTAGRVSLVTAERGAVEEALVANHEFQPAERGTYR